VSSAPSSDYKELMLFCFIGWESFSDFLFYPLPILLLLLLVFLFSDYLQAIEKCSLETHCPNGQGDCPFPQSCWQGLMDCDVRDFTPFELGGFLNKPTQQQLAEAMGLSYPSDDVSISVFVAVQLNNKAQ
jgi:hypothetical protein